MVSKVTFKIKLEDFVENPSDLTRAEKTKLKNEVGNLLIEKISNDANAGRSSVSGQKWKGLSKDYKKLKLKTIGSGSADLELTGSMLDSLEFKRTQDGIEIGVFRSKQAKKADGHCHTKVFGKSELPKRQFIPGKGESLRSGIMKEVVLLAQALLDEDEEENNQE